MSRIKNQIIRFTERVGRMTITSHVIGGVCPHCGLTHSVEATRENHARVGLQESFDFCGSVVLAQPQPVTAS